MNQNQLIAKIKYAFERVHKKLGVFQVGELDNIFSEPETPLEEKPKKEEGLAVATPMIKEAIKQEGDDKNGK